MVQEIVIHCPRGGNCPMKKPLKIILIILAVIVGLIAALLIWLTATQLTELCKEDKAAISRTLSQLSSKGLVSCELPEHKRSYRTLYYLTEEGNTVVKKISSRIYSALAHGGDGMTEEQRLNLYDSLERISHNLEQYLTEFSVKHPTEK